MTFWDVLVPLLCYVLIRKYILLIAEKYFMFNFQMFSVWVCFLKKLIFTDKNRRMIQLNKRYCYASSQQWSLLKEMTKLQVTFFPLSLKWLVWNCFINAKHAQGRANFDSFFFFKQTVSCLLILFMYGGEKYLRTCRLSEC